MNKTEELHKKACDSSKRALKYSLNIPFEVSSKGAKASVAIGGVVIASSLFVQNSIHRNSMLTIGALSIGINGIRLLNLHKKK